MKFVTPSNACLTRSTESLQPAYITCCDVNLKTTLTQLRQAAGVREPLAYAPEPFASTCPKTALKTGLRLRLLDSSCKDSLHREELADVLAFTHSFGGLAHFSKLSLS